MGIKVSGFFRFSDFPLEEEKGEKKMNNWGFGTPVWHQPVFGKERINY
jgi:hypothetical protein